MKQIFEILRRSTSPILLAVVCLGVALTTRPLSLREISGADYPQDGQYSMVSLVDAVNYLPGRIERYFNAEFSGHDGLVHAYYQFRLNVLGERNFNDVLVGNAGWLYYTGERNMDYYQRAELMMPDQIDSLLRQLSATRAALERQGIAFYVVVAPNKESIYPEFLPAGIQKNEKAALLDQILAAKKDPKLNLIDLRPALLQAKQDGQVYYRTDTHWNPMGAFGAYREILNRMGKELPALKPYAPDDFRRAPEVISGDLSGMLTMTNILTEDSYEMQPVFARRAVTAPSEDGLVYKSTVADPALPRVMVFHDSFYNGLKPFMAENFREATLVHAFHLDMDWIAQERPDAVILEVAERYLPELLIEK
jgi:alginate O-acetyltransferase complex protein AlgJ